MNHRGNALMPFAVALAVIVLGLGIAVAWAIGINNQIVRLDQGVAGSWAQVQNVYQMRSDLIGNLVETVKGYARHEAGTLQAVTEARARATSVTVTPETLKDPAALQRFEAAQGAMSSALSRLLVSVERYPDLKANHNFMDLQRRLAAVENRALLERQRFNAAVRAYNTRVKLFPGNLLAGALGYTGKPFFEAAPGATTAPAVRFDK